MQQNLEPGKWRECIDPLTLPLGKLKIREIIGYPHAANQVFHVCGEEAGNMGFYYLKFAHHPDANVKNEVETIDRLENLPVPRIVKYAGQTASHKWNVF